MTDERDYIPANIAMNTQIDNKAIIIGLKCISSGTVIIILQRAFLG